ncbi:MAG: phosphatase PAP2 family protein [Lachnospiraceae bacterium]|nr:phosphatase PAP2 family protein [Lachnospiraceae bacterium]
MELHILHMIQSWHQEWLSPFMVFFSTIANKGIGWILLCLVLLAIPRTRKCGWVMACAMLLTLILGEQLLKNLVARKRPCVVDTSVELLIPRPRSYSFPSGHTANSFAPAVSLFLFYRKPGMIALLIAAVIAFSRMYLFVHYPTDILGGILLGTMDAMIVYFCFREKKTETSKLK